MPPAVLLRHLAKAYASKLTVPVVFGAFTTRGFLDHEAALIGEDTGPDVKREQRVLQVMAGALPSTCQQNSSITVDGTVYEVRSPPLAFNDGQETRYLLSPVVA